MSINANPIIVAVNKKAKTQMTWGVIFIVWNILMISVALTDTELRNQDGSLFTILFCGAFVLLGAWMFYCGISKKKHMEMFNVYCPRLYGQRAAYELNFAEMAKILQRSEDEVRKEVTFFQKHYIWEILYGGEQAVYKRENMIEEHNKKQANRLVSVVCESCNASSTVNVNQPGVSCEYCGASLIEEVKKARK